VRLLLDTHIALWALVNDARLSSVARNLLENQNNGLFISTASLWEIAVKRSIGRTPIPLSANEARDYFGAAGYQLLDIRPDHAIAVETLPLIHADPFDRLLIAQARTEPMHLVTHDKTIAQYGESVILV
jgi:PIN domain nuclease of toxin-antitoxin system